MQDLPNSTDEYWEGEKYSFKPVSIAICSTHTKENWTTHEGYKFENGIVTCTKCPWGSPVAGYYKVLEGKICDLRTA